MINRPPTNFQLTEETENLFLFYQCIMEGLFDYSPDSYKPPILNTRLLCREAYETYCNLLTSNSIDKYYNTCIIPIIDELLESIQSDIIAKSILGLRYNAIINRLKIGKKDHKVFKCVIENLDNYFNNHVYYNCLHDNLSDLIKKRKHHREIIKLSKIWITEIINLGYSKQHVYNITKRFFNVTEIVSSNAIDEFFQQFSFEEQMWELYGIADKELVYYLRGLQRIFKDYPNQLKIQECIIPELKELCNKNEFKELNFVLSKALSLNTIGHVTIIKSRCRALDPYSALKHIQGYISQMMAFVTNFDHRCKQVYQYNVCLSYIHPVISMSTAMEKRIKKQEQSYLPHTLKMLRNVRFSRQFFFKFIKALEYHCDALSQMSNDKYVVSILWTILENFFVSGKQRNKGKCVKKSLIEIIQRTYIIKRLKYLQTDMLSHLQATNSALVKKYNLSDIRTFISMLFDDPTSTRYKDIYATLSSNILLRYRLYEIVNQKLCGGKEISVFLKSHRQRIEYQIERIYRERNFLVHSGESMWYREETIECLHYYIDFVINFILAKTEQGEKISDMCCVIAEAESDNAEHRLVLNENNATKTDASNYMELLFGPSTNVVNYYKDRIV